ncbi:MAG TPA: PEP-CTERM sorting domain-containing protein, partial [Steroidobacteraceae bacterium]|nr:PEP-CTERM sorting domain-containing protein [Steroidobacteraceae bacterium]
LIGATHILSVTLSAYLDTADVDFGLGTLIQSDKYTSAGASGTINHTLPFVNGPFSETFVVDAQFTGGAVATLYPSIILNTTVIPEPGTLTLLSTALAGLSMIRRRRKTAE